MKRPGEAPMGSDHKPDLPPGLAREDSWRELGKANADRLRLAQALRLLRDTTSPGGYVENVCVSALNDCGIEDPPEEDHA